MSSHKTDTWQPWQMDTFDQPAVKNAPTPLRPESKPDQLMEILQEQTRQAHEKAISEGYSKGFNDGQKAGMAQGFQEGYSDGLKQAQEQIQAQGQEHMAQLTTLLDSYSSALRHLEAEVGQQLISLAIQIARQVVRSTLEHHPEKLLDIIEDILHVNPDDSTLLRLRVHPTDLELITAYGQERQSSADKPWQVISDPSLQPGGCIAETALGEIDASLETRWNRVIASLGHNTPWVKQ